MSLAYPRFGTDRQRGDCFGELRRRTEAAGGKMSARTLRTVERDGFVHREAHPVIPPRVDHSLTRPGPATAEPATGPAWRIELRPPEVEPPTSSGTFHAGGDQEWVRSHAPRQCPDAEPLTGVRHGPMLGSAPIAVAHGAVSALRAPPP
ncbi:winged helix-turn-helix transcriptional regulator [Peterkaempfera sp. SMS 1(5)a]|uniref:winged helix-turn-helix transcriptional regulator n=1 Tax=Peterkaempfera podocarpi TaxID=3232308 RepID=UPI00366DC22F